MVTGRAGGQVGWSAPDPKPSSSQAPVTSTRTTTVSLASYSITSSARPSSVSGNVRPGALAVFSSTFVVSFGWTGSSVGFSPFEREGGSKTCRYSETTNRPTDASHVYQGNEPYSSIELDSEMRTTSYYVYRI
jgi:hypothetical protein